MMRVVIGAMLGVWLAAVVSGALAAEGTNTEPVCRKAEINPVTGHVFCIDPKGAAVPPPPEDIAPACNEDESRGQWTWSPNCRPAKGS